MTPVFDRVFPKSGSLQLNIDDAVDSPDVRTSIKPVPHTPESPSPTLETQSKTKEYASIVHQAFAPMPPAVPPKVTQGIPPLSQDDIADASSSVPNTQSFLPPHMSEEDPKELFIIKPPPTDQLLHKPDVWKSPQGGSRSSFLPNVKLSCPPHLLDLDNIQEFTIAKVG